MKRASTSFPRRRTPVGVVVSVVLALSAALGLLAHALETRSAARASFPASEGELEIEGLRAPLEIFRDHRGIPHVEAESQQDAFFGLGFVHAQDRLGQMVWLSRVAQGRAAALAGGGLLDSDRLARVLDFSGLAAREYERLDVATRRLLDAYARGVNAQIAQIRAGRAGAPLSLQRLGVKLEDWSPADSLALLKTYSWGLSGTLEVSLVLAEVVQQLGRYGASPFFPEPTLAQGEGPAPAPLARAGSPRPADHPARPWSDPVRRAAHLEGRSIGSSAFAIAGAHTRSGLPILVADSHQEPTVPALFHVAHLRATELDVAGAMLAGVPLVWTGMNPHLAWASTHARALTTDLFEETLHESDAHLYHDGRGWRRFAERTETIQVRGGQDHALLVRETGHGPLLDEVLPDAPRPLSVRWVGADARGGETLRAMLGVARAQSAAELRSALHAHHEPPLALVYVDDRSALGLQVAGWIPDRELSAGPVPLPGRARSFEWKGRIPFERLPHAALEGNGWVIAADNALADPDPKSPIEWLWRTGERARRIETLLAQSLRGGRVSLRQMASLQADVHAPRSQELVRAVLALSEPAAALAPEAREVLDLLASWDGRAAPESIGAAAYHVFLERLTRSVLEQQLGPELSRRYAALPQADPEQVVFQLMRQAAEGSSRDARKRAAETVRATLRETWFQLSYRMGPNRRKWSWGRLHSLAFRTFVPGAPGRLVRSALGPFPYGGSGSTVSAAEYLAGDDYAVRVASTFRFAIDAAALDEALIGLAPGPSEHPGHPDYDGGLARWLAGRPALLATSRLLVEEVSPARLTLRPVRTPAS